jgi:hypothetical protein
VENLEAVIRAQRRSIDRIEGELSYHCRKAGESDRERSPGGWAVGRALSAAGGGPFFGGHAGYRIEPSAN